HPEPASETPAPADPPVARRVEPERERERVRERERPREREPERERLRDRKPDRDRVMTPPPVELEPLPPAYEEDEFDDVGRPDPPPAGRPAGSPGPAGAQYGRRGRPRR